MLQKVFRFTALPSFALLVSGCVTHIHERNDTIRPPLAPLGQYPQVMLQKINPVGAPQGSDKAVAYIQRVLDDCMADVFRGLHSGGAPAAGAAGPILTITPEIVDLKKVSGTARFWAGAFAGSSAVLMKVSFTDDTGRVLSEPIFYSKANAMAAAWTFGTMDNKMLGRLAHNACGYSKQYL
jgi:hypothetical protein